MPYAYTVCNNPECNQTIHEVPVLVAAFSILDCFISTIPLTDADLIEQQDLVKDLLDDDDLTEVQRNKVAAHLVKDQDPQAESVEPDLSVDASSSNGWSDESHQKYQQAKLDSLFAQTRLTNAQAHHQELLNKEFAMRFGIEG